MKKRKNKNKRLRQGQSIYILTCLGVIVTGLEISNNYIKVLNTLLKINKIKIFKNKQRALNYYYARGKDLNADSIGSLYYNFITKKFSDDLFLHFNINNELNATKLNAIKDFCKTCPTWNILSEGIDKFPLDTKKHLISYISDLML